jgi:mannosyltransferase OCH1-like enzyme
MSESLKYKNFFSKKSASYTLIPENNNFLIKNVLVLPEFLKNKNFINGKSPSFARVLEK